jgi:hypothetical protein
MWSKKSRESAKIFLFLLLDCIIFRCPNGLYAEQMAWDGAEVERE